MSVIGHSRGARTALKIGSKINEIKKIILLGPPRRVRERSKNRKDVKYFSERFRKTHQFVYGEPIPDWFTHQWETKAGPRALEDYMEPFLKEGHKPLMLVDGELEDKRDKMYLEELYSSIKEPKRFVRLSKSDHYHNTAQTLGIILYDKEVITQLTNEIVFWLK